MADVLRDVVDAEVEFTGVKPNVAWLYEPEDDDGCWSFAIPAGQNEYDVIYVMRVAEIRAKEKTVELRRMFRRVKTPRIAKAPSAVRNRYFVLIADKIAGKFFRMRKVLYPSGRMDFFYVFASKWGTNGIHGRLYRLLGKLYSVRGERMGQNLKFELYGVLAKIKEWFTRFGQRLLELSERILGSDFVPRRKMRERARAQEALDNVESKEHALKLVLHYAKQVDETFYRNVAALAAVT